MKGIQPNPTCTSGISGVPATYGTSGASAQVLASGVSAPAQVVKVSSHFAHSSVRTESFRVGSVHSGKWVVSSDIESDGIESFCPFSRSH